MKTTQFTKTMFFLLLTATLHAQLPTWKHAINLDYPITFHLDQADTMYFFTASSPQQFLKVSPNGQTVFHKPITLDGNSFFAWTAIIDTLDGYMVAAGTLSAPGTLRFAVAKISLRTGQVLQWGAEPQYWASMFSGYDRLSLNRSGDGNIYLISHAAMEPGSIPQMLAVRFDANLNVTDTWLNPVFTNGLGAGITGNDGSCFYDGYYYDDAAGEGRYYLEKLRLGIPDSIYWRHELDGRQYVIKILQLPDNDLLLLLNEQQNNSIYRTVVQRIRDIGSSAQVIWSAEIPILDAEMYALHYDQVHDKIFVAGSYFFGESMEPEQSHSGYASLRAADGELLWKHQTAGGQYRVSNDIITDGAGRLCVVGNRNLLSSQLPYWMAYFTQNGQQIDVLSYDGICPNGHNQALFARFRKDGKLLVSGSACESESTANWCTTLMYANLPPLVISDAPLLELNTGVRLYPNPVFNTLYLTSESFFQSDLVIRDLTGCVVLEYKNQAFPAELPVDDLHSGSYFLTAISSDAKETVIARFVKI